MSEIVGFLSAAIDLDIKSLGPITRDGMITFKTYESFRSLHTLLTSAFDGSELAVTTNQPLTWTRNFTGHLTWPRAPTSP